MEHNLKDQNGSAFLLLLITLTILSVLIGSMHSLASSIIRSRYTQIHADIGKASAISNSLIEFLTTDSTTFTERLHCSDKNGQVGRIDIWRSLCATYTLIGLNLIEKNILDGETLHQKELFPQFDFNHIFFDLVPCQTIPSSKYGQTSSGFKLSMESVKSELICKGIPGINSSFYSVSANMEIDGDVEIPALTNGYYLLASTGYLETIKSLTITKDTLVVAGGDLHIKSLNSKLTSSPEVTLVSATGKVNLEEVVGAPRLRIISWLTPTLPIGVVVLGNSVFPPFLPQEALGFNPVRASE